MFRRPMRIEKWIAFDGAFVDTLDTTQPLAPVDDGDADSPNESGAASEPAIENAEDLFGNSLFDDDSSSDPFFAPFSTQSDDVFKQSFEVSYHHGFWEYEAKASIAMPGNVSISGLETGESFMPFWGNDAVNFNSGKGLLYAQGTDFFFELGAPEGGSFTLTEWSDVKDNQHQFITENNLHHYSGQWHYVAFHNGSTEAGMKIVFMEVHRSGHHYNFKTYNIHKGGQAVAQYTDEGGIRFVVTNKGGTTFGNAVAESLLHSLVYTKTTATEAETVTDYTMSVYYNEGTSRKDLPSLFTDEEGGIFHPDNEPKGNLEIGKGEPPIIDPTPPGPPPTPLPEPLPDPEPDPDPPAPEPDPDPDDDNPKPEPEQPADPDNDLFAPPSVDGGESGNDGNADSAGESPSGEQTSDAAAAAEQRDDLVYIYRRDDDFGENNDEALLEEEEEDLSEAEAEMVATGEMYSHGYFVAGMAELAKEAESVLHAVRGGREMLEQSLAGLRDEYLFRDSSEWASLRNFLRTMFEAGNKEKTAIDRVISEMNRQVSEFQDMPLNRRDGMIAESLRELMDSAARRSGETGALAKAMGSLVDLLRTTRTSALQPPTEQELARLFETTYQNAKREWEIRHERTDPMGKELASVKK